MYVSTFAHDLVCGVLYRVDSASVWMFSNTHRVTQAPSESGSLGIKVIAGFSYVFKVECFDLAMARRQLFSESVDVGCTPSTN